MKKEKISKRISAMFLSAALAVTGLAFGGIGTQPVAAEEGAKTVAGLSTTVIKAPETEATFNKETGRRNSWVGSYVWYGKYNGKPVKYRVLSPRTTEYGGTTMFLDCDNVLYEVAFDKDGTANSGQTYPNEWDGSDLKVSLNGLDFLWKSNGFTDLERYAIKGSTIASHDRGLDLDAMGVLYSPIGDFGNFVGLTGEKIFVLDIGEMVPKYGYFFPQKLHTSGDAWIWWTRSAHDLVTTSYGSYVGYVPNFVYSYGNVTGTGYSMPLGASPAFNVDVNSILFSSVVSGAAGMNNAEYKLTLLDNQLKMKFVETNGVVSSAVVGQNKTDVSMRVSLYGNNAASATQLSVVILNKEYEAGNSNRATILHYGKMVVPEGLDTVSSTKTALFSLPSFLKISDWGQTYYVYVIAESVNGLHESDYASAPLKLDKPKVSYNAPVINKQPGDTSVKAGETATFTTGAQGSGKISYQWQSRKNDSATWVNSGQNGAKTGVLKVNAQGGLDGWQFRCIVTDEKGNQSISRTAKLTILATITKQPANTEAVAGTTAKFSVTAVGSAPLTYQWQSRKDSSGTWVNSGQSGARSANLSVKTNAGLNGYQFRCIIKDKTGYQTISNTAVLSIVPLAIKSQPQNKSVTAGETATFTIVAEGKGTLTYQWQSRKNSSGTWVNSGQNGAKSATLNVKTNAGLNGYQFRCIVKDASGNQRISNTVTLSIIPKITKHPGNGNVPAGSKAVFTISATGTGTLKYQWQSRKNSSTDWVNSGQSGAKTSTLTVTTNAGLNGYQFRCIVTDGNGQKATSNVATLTVK